MMVAARLCIAALLCSVALHAQTSAPPDLVQPFPAGLTGTLVFHSDKPGPDNPDARNHIFTLDLATGKINWHYQATAGDAWNVACYIKASGNCPEDEGPDHDFGAAGSSAAIKRVLDRCG